MHLAAMLNGRETSWVVQQVAEVPSFGAVGRPRARRAGERRGGRSGAKGGRQMAITLLQARPHGWQRQDNPDPRPLSFGRDRPSSQRHRAAEGT